MLTLGLGLVLNASFSFMPCFILATFMLVSVLGLVLIGFFRFDFSSFFVSSVLKFQLVIV